MTFQPKEKILIVMTSHRLDCLKICLEMLERHDVFAHFDKCGFLLNGVVGEHLEYIKAFMKRRSDVTWSTVKGPRGRSERISNLENEFVKKNPDAVYVKIDEDVFVYEGFAEKLLAAYDAFKHDDDLALVTTLMPNNPLGLYTLLTDYYPESLEDFRKAFGADPDPDIHSDTWRRPDVAEWATRRWLDLAEVNRLHQARIKELNDPLHHTFTRRFSVGCVCWDYRHWTQMGGIPPKDEPEWCAWVEDNGKFNVLDTSQIALHYSFFVQQEWLDRSHLLEDLRMANLPESLPSKSFTGYTLPWLKRSAGYLPNRIKRKLSTKKNWPDGRAS